MISTIDEPRGAFTCPSSTLEFWPILTRFVDYYSPFWGPEAISIVVEPQGALTCRSSVVIVLADSGPFRGLLLTFWGTGLISTINEPGVRLRVGHQHSQFGRFWLVSWTITH